MKKLLVLNGPNLNRLGMREPEVYGRQTLADIESLVRDEAEHLGVDVSFFQSNHEGALVDAIHKAADEGIAAIIFNPGAYTHTSIALRDAISAVKADVVEVHISNVHAREDFRHKSFISGVARGVIAGFGASGYIAALRLLAG